MPTAPARICDRTNAFAHFRAFGALCDVARPCVAGDLDSLVYASEELKSVIPVRNFAVHGQLDNDHAQPYAVRWGYELDSGSHNIMCAADVRALAKPLDRLEVAMERMAKLDGAPATIGHTIARLARALRVDWLVVMPARPWGSESTSPIVTYRPAMAGEAVWYIDEQCRKAHVAARKACGETVDA
jgi:hypothetical protein